MADNLELVPIGNLNISKVVFGIPETADIKDDKGIPMGEYNKCTLHNTSSDDKEIPLILEAPEELCYGIQKEYAFGKPKISQNFRGYHVCYYLSNSDSSKTKDQTEDQKKFLLSLRQLEKKLATHMKEHAEFLPEKAADLAAAGKLVSPIAKFPKKLTESEKNPKAKRKVSDTSKPLRFYIRMIVNKKTDKFISQFYGPGDKPMDPLSQCLDIQGYIKPAIKIEYIYIGESSATFQMKLWECTYKPTEGSQRKRLIGKNTTPLYSEVPETSNPNEDLDDVLQDLMSNLINVF